MKNYRKPDLFLISLHGNEQLCGSCTVSIKPGTGDPGAISTVDSLIKDALGYNSSPGVVTKDELEQCFGLPESCTHAVDLQGYCKFTPAGKSVAWS